MHIYSQLGNTKPTIPIWVYFVGAIGTGASYVTGWALDLIGENYGYYAQAPSALLFYTIVYIGFEKVLWRWRFIRRICFIDTPDLNRKWDNIRIIPDTHNDDNALSDADEAVLKEVGSQNGIAATMHIHQTFSTINISLDTPATFSTSSAASIEIESPTRIVLRNQYKAKPKATIGTKRIEPHEGTNSIVFELVNGVMTPIGGSYYTESRRSTHGYIGVV